MSSLSLTPVEGLHAPRQPAISPFEDPYYEVDSIDGWRRAPWDRDLIQLWVSWASGEHTWEPEEILLEDVPDLVHDFWPDRGRRSIQNNNLNSSEDSFATRGVHARPYRIRCLEDWWLHQDHVFSVLPGQTLSSWALRDYCDFMGDSIDDSIAQCHYSDASRACNISTRLHDGLLLLHEGTEFIEQQRQELLQVAEGHIGRAEARIREIERLEKQVISC